MCLSPGKIVVNQEVIPVQCRNCDECRAHQRRRLLGQVLAQQKTSDHVWFTTFTYGGGYDNEKAYVLNYADVQNANKRLRRAGYKFKYIAVGEYGEELGRAHWHVLYFWEGEPPETDWSPTEQWKYWDKGHTHNEIPRSKTGTAAYCMKYVGKGADGYNGVKRSSNLGWTYCLEYARKHARMGLTLFAKGNIYTIEGGQNNRHGKPFYYPVEKTSGLYKAMLEAWLDQWAISHPNRDLALSELTTEYLEDVCQDTTNLKTRTQRYILERYGYGGDYDAPVKQKVVYNTKHPGIMLTAHWTGYRLEQWHRDQRIWYFDILPGVHYEPGELAPPEEEAIPVTVQALVDKKLSQQLHRTKALYRVERMADADRRKPKPSANQHQRPPPGGGTQSTHQRLSRSQTRNH